MSHRLFRFADMMDYKYQITSFGVKHRPMSERQRRQLEEQRERTEKIKEVGDKETESDLIRNAKSKFISFFNSYLSPSDIAYNNKYSPITNIERVGKNKVLRSLFLFGSPDAKVIYRVLDSIFPGKDTSGDLDNIPLTVLANRVKIILDILTDKDKIKNMAAILRSRFPQDVVTEANVLISDLNDLHRAASEVLSGIAHTFSTFSKGKEVEMPQRPENIPISELNRVLRNWKLGFYGTSKDTFEYVGINNDDDFVIASMPGIRPTLEKVIYQNRHGMKFPTDGPKLKKLIEDYKEKQKPLPNTTVLDLLDEPRKSPRVLDPAFTLKDPEGESVIRNEPSTEEQLKLYREMVAREETGTGGGDTSI